MAKRKKKKSTAAIVQDRVDVVAELLMDGLKAKDIFRYVAENENYQWEVTTRQIDNYIQKANHQLVETVKAKRGDLAEELIGKFEYVYFKQMETEDYRGASKTLVNLAAVAGITSYRKDETNFNLNVKTIVAVPTE